MRWVKKPIAVSVILLFVWTSTHICTATAPGAAETTVPIHRISDEGVHEQVGKIDLTRIDTALELIVDLNSFPPGWHAMHVHENPSCDAGLVGGRMVAGAAAGRHFDPTGAMRMAPGRIVSPLMPDGAAEAFGPRDGKAKMKGLAGPGSSKADASKKPGLPPDRHPRPVGDLPAVHVNEDGSTIYRILTYRVRLEQLRGHSIMLHKYGEAPIDPALPRGGGERMACGIIK